VLGWSQPAQTVQSFGSQRTPGEEKQLEEVHGACRQPCLVVTADRDSCLSQDWMIMLGNAIKRGVRQVGAGKAVKFCLNRVALLSLAAESRLENDST
jgi:hypothetical protein